MLDHLKGKAVTQTAFLLGVHKRKNGAPGAIRTPDPQIRSLVLYPAELRAPEAEGIAERPSGRNPERPQPGRGAVRPPFCPVRGAGLRP